MFLKFGIWDFEFRILCLGFGVWCLGYQIWGFGLWDLTLEFKVWIVEISKLKLFVWVLEFGVFGIILELGISGL